MARAQALVLALTFQFCAPETETPAAGCTFEEASDPVVPCEFSHNQTIRECVKMERGASRYTIKNLLPFRNIHVRLILTNPEGRKEGKEVTFQTDEDVPGGIAAESLTFTPLEDMIFLKWEEPQEPNGLITQYEISYQSIESSAPSQSLARNE